MNVICENVRCFQPDCQLRHPKTCRYFSTYSYCKFGDYCKFGHGEIRNSNIDKEIDNLKSEIETLKKVIEGKDTQIKEKDEEIRKMLDVDKTKVEEKLKKRINCLEKQNENLEVENRELNDKGKAGQEEVESLRNQMAVDFMLLLDFKERMRDKYLYDTEDEESEYESNDEIREKRRELFRKTKAEARKGNLNCKMCDFKGKNEAGLKTHITKKHK